MGLTQAELRIIQAELNEALNEAMDVDDPGIPGADNRWFPTQGEARQAALREAKRRGPGHRIVHHPRPALGHPHYHVARGWDQVSGHFFYSSRLPRKQFKGRPNRESEAFSIKNTFPSIPEGHERLTRDAASRFPAITRDDVKQLVEGSRRVDYHLPNHFRADQQRRHALRRSLCQPLGAALHEIRATLATLHTQILAAYARGSRAAAFALAGEALHLIQDSYSDAHMERDFKSPGAPITYIRYFGLLGRPYPIEHQLLPDPRDRILNTRGSLIATARAAISTSKGYLTLILRHFTGVPRSFALRELTAFMNRHLTLSPRAREPKAVYTRCRLF